MSDLNSFPEPIDYGNGVLYFRPKYWDVGNFDIIGRWLSYYLKTHPEIQIVSMAGDCTLTGYNEGYFVVVRSKGDLK